MTSEEKISKLVFHLLTVAILMLVGMWVYFLSNISAFENIAKSNVLYPIQWETVSYIQLYVAAILSLIPHLFIVWGAMHLRNLFAAFSVAKVFDKDNAKAAMCFAKSLVLFWLTNLVVSILVSVVLSWHHGSGQKVLSVQMNSAHFAVLLLGLVFWVIAKVLHQAHQLEQENNSFV